MLTLSSSTVSYFHSIWCKSFSSSSLSFIHWEFSLCYTSCSIFCQNCLGHLYVWWSFNLDVFLSKFSVEPLCIFMEHLALSVLFAAFVSLWSLLVLVQSCCFRSSLRFVRSLSQSLLTLFCFITVFNISSTLKTYSNSYNYNGFMVSVCIKCLSPFRPHDLEISQSDHHLS